MTVLKEVDKNCIMCFMFNGKSRIIIQNNNENNFYIEYKSLRFVNNNNYPNHFLRN